MDEVVIEEQIKLIRWQMELLEHYKIESPGHWGCATDADKEKYRAITRSIYDRDFEEERIPLRLFILELWDWYSYPRGSGFGGGCGSSR